MLLRSALLIALGVLPGCFSLLAAQPSFIPVDPAISFPVADDPAPVAPPLLYGINGGRTIELGQAVKLTVSFYGTGADQTYTWSRNDVVIPDATLVSYTITAATATDAATYSVRVTNAAGSSIASTALTVKPLAPPVIVNTSGNIVRQVGQEAAFMFNATGSYPRSYQWRKNGGDIPGATLPRYAIPAVALTDAGTYSVVVTNSQGSATMTPASLSVNAATPVNIDPAQPADVSGVQGATLSLSIWHGGSTPFTYQWRKNGVPIAGATVPQLRFEPLKTSDAGKYSVIVSNPAGSATSREATVTVTPATPITIGPAPTARTLHEGQSATIHFGVSGSSPIRFQWLKNGTPISGATYSTYTISNAKLSDGALYSVTATNAAGSVTSAGASVSVIPATRPAITRQPTGGTVPYAGSFSLSVTATGTPNLRYAWKRNGVSLDSGNSSSSLYIRDAKPETQSGTYTVTVSNQAGSVTSAGAIITVLAPVPPKIDTQPKSVEVATGRSASFSIQYTATGAGHVTAQWRKNGVTIPGANSTSLHFNSVKATDAGMYTITLSGPGGAVASQSATLTVLPAEPPHPRYGWIAAWNQVSLGGSLYLSQHDIEGSPPFSYQWAKNGVVIQGATSNAYSIAKITAADLADYTLTVSNEAGVITSPPIRVMRSQYANNTSTPWLDAAQAGDTVYFLATAPNRIERYDLAGERWLPTTLLGESRLPTAFVPASEGVYIAYGRTLVRRPLDLSTETALTNTPAEVPHVFVFDAHLYYSAGTRTNAYSTLNRTSLQPGPSATIGRYQRGYRHVAFAPELRKGFGRSTNTSRADIESFTIAADGSSIGSVDSQYRGLVPVASRTYVLPGEQFVTDDSGTVYRTADLSYVASFGEGFTDLAVLADGSPVLLRGNRIAKVRMSDFQLTGATAIASAGLRIFTRGANAFVFGEAADGSAYAVTKVPGTALVPPAPPVAGVLPARYSVDDAFVNPDGIVHVFSRTVQGLVRWSAATRSFLPTIPLRAAPALISHQPGASRVLIAYLDGMITILPLGTGPAAESSIGQVSHRVRAVTDLDDLVLLNLPSAQSSGDFRLIMDFDGVYRHIAERNSYYGNGFAWVRGSRRLYSQPAFSAGIQYEVVPTSGALDTPYGTVLPTNTTTEPPYRFNPDATLIVTGNGRVLDGELKQVGILANNILDGAWLADGLVTLRKQRGETEVQTWSKATYLQAKTKMLAGTPVRLARLSDSQLVVVTIVSGAPAFTVLNADLSVAGTPASPITFTRQPASQAPKATGSAHFVADSTGPAGTVTYRWKHDGVPLAAGAQAQLSVDNIDSANAGLYTVAATHGTTTLQCDPAILGVFSTEKVIGAGSEVGADIQHQNKNVYDQVLLEGAAATVTADPGQVLRISFIDLSDDIVQVEFSGIGTMTIVLDDVSGPAAPVNYHQPDVTYRKGHARIIITGADEDTHLGVFSVGRATAVNQDLFRDGVDYDGIADVAYIAIESPTGRFGGLRAANATCFGTAGHTGIYAPGVHFSGPVYIGDITAFDQATPVLSIGSSPDTRVTGGNLAQSNGQPVRITGLTQLKFMDGSDSHGALLPAQPIRSRLEKFGTDVTGEVAVSPGM